ncbi:MAG: aquaporin family protein [bacterium]|nr:aquaporin family protein [bacterium]
MNTTSYSLIRRLVAEGVGTAFLLMAVVGGGIAAQRLSPDDVGLQLLEAALVTAFVLMILIWSLGPVSGAHFNPCVTLIDVVLGNRSPAEGTAYVGSQMAGGILGTVLANLMFELDAIEWSGTVRGGGGQLLAEVIATLGLMMVIFMIARPGGLGLGYVAPAVGVYIGGAYFFTSSTSFANPAVTIARMFSDTFAGIAPASAPAFIGMQLVGAGLALLLVRFLVTPE